MVICSFQLSGKSGGSKQWLNTFAPKAGSDECRDKQIVRVVVPQSAVPRRFTAGERGIHLQAGGSTDGSRRGSQETCYCMSGHVYWTLDLIYMQVTNYSLRNFQLCYCASHVRSQPHMLYFRGAGSPHKPRDVLFWLLSPHCNFFSSSRKLLEDYLSKAMPLTSTVFPCCHLMPYSLRYWQYD